jgi:hypothetical protein
MSHATAASLLSHVRKLRGDNAQIVIQRVITLVDTEGIDLIAELWSGESPDTLPGILWRLYTLREWMRKRSKEIIVYWNLGEPVEGAASAISGLDAHPDPQSIIATADSILRGAFTGDFAVALERAGSFCITIAEGMKQEAARRSDSRLGESLQRTASNLTQTSSEFIEAATLWRKNALE